MSFQLTQEQEMIRLMARDFAKKELEPFAKETPFIIRADKDVSLQHFIDVADVLKQLGFAKVAVQTETR